MSSVYDGTTTVSRDVRGGFQRHVVAIAGGLLLIALVLLLPDLGPAPAGAAVVELAHARIVEITPPAEEGVPPTAVVEVLDGPRAGQLVEANVQGPPGQMEPPDYAVGDEVVVTVNPATVEIAATVSDRWRIRALA